MLEKGKIVAIDFNSNICQVHIPIFDSAGDTTEFICDALIAITPGIINSYNIDDTVIVGFESNTLDNPIILGKLFVGTNEDLLAQGHLSIKSITCSNDASIPLTTQLTVDPNKDIASIKGSYSDYKSITDIIDKIRALESELEDIKNGLEN